LGILGTIAGFVLGFIPFIKAYKLAIQIISLIVLVFGVYLEGGLADYKEWELKVAEMQVKIAQAETKSSEKNVEIQEKVVEKTKVIREKGKDIIKYLDREVVKKEEVKREKEELVKQEVAKVIAETKKPQNDSTTEVKIINVLPPMKKISLPESYETEVE
jgi:hypothetical protein